MLTPNPLASGQARYYLSLTATSYYTEAPEPAGRWYGLGAEEFGLKGTVRAEDLEQLCRGYDPRDPSRHVRNAEREDGVPPDKKMAKRKHGEDLCFSPPKSVSVAWALAPPELRAAIEHAFDRAVKDALDYIQEQCGWSRVGAQGQSLERVPLTFALFEHSSSRAGDPQLHAHAVLPNTTLRTDSRGKLVVTAIDSTLIYDIQMSAGALMRASLAAGLERIGFEVEREGFAFRIKGISEDLCERFSQRRAEIVEGILEAAKMTDHLSKLDAREVLLAARGRMAELVTLSTRERKEEYTREQLFPVWKDIARGLGIEEGYVEKLINRPRTLDPSEKRAVKEEVFEAAISRITGEFSHFSEADLTQRLAEEAQCTGLSARDVRELAQAKIGTQDVLRLGEVVTAKKNHERNSFREKTEARFTTEEILKMEGLMLGAVERMSQKSAAIPQEFADAAIKRTNDELARIGKELTAEQTHAVRLLTAGTGLIACMTGKAGTGKSTALDTCRDAWERAGKVVLGCALQGSAADELQRTAGIKSATLHSTLFRLENGWLTLSKNHVVVLDEGGQVPTKLLAALVHQVEKAGAKLVCVGDPKQLQAIGAGGPFKSISERLGEAGHCVLTKIIRQREEWRRDAVEHFSRGEAREALIAYAARNQLHVPKTREEAVSGLVARWKTDNGVEKPQDVLLLASLNAEVRAVNRLCQEARREAGKLGENRLFVNGQHIHEGDRVQLGKNNKKLGVMNGFTGEVTKADEINGWLTVRLDKDGREVSLSVKNYGAKHIALGYATTVHKSQGRTVEHCHVLMGGHLSDLHLAYVQASRCRESTHLFIDQAHAGPDLRDAIRALSRDRSKDLARDILDRQQLQEEQAQQHERRRGHSIGR